MSAASGASRKAALICVIRSIEELSPERFLEIKKLREENAYGNVTNNTQDRLRVREKCQLAKLNLLKRSLE